MDAMQVCFLNHTNIVTITKIIVVLELGDKDMSGHGHYATVVVLLSH